MWSSCNYVSMTVHCNATEILSLQFLSDNQRAIFCENSIETVSAVTAGKLISQTREMLMWKNKHWHGTPSHVSCLLLWRTESLLLDSTLNDCGGRQASVSFWTESWTYYTISVSLFLLRASYLISKCAGHLTINQSSISCCIMSVTVG